MTVINLINRLLGRPELLENGYPNMAANLGEPRVVHGMEYEYWLPTEPPQLSTDEMPMVAEEIYNLKESTKPAREYPTTTSTLSSNYLINWCGSTSHNSFDLNTEKSDPLVLDHWPLKRMLTKLFPWILDVTEVRIKPKGGMSNLKPNYVSGTIYFGPLEIHITVSPTHYSELMSPKIEKKVREKLYTEILPLITCMFENNSKDKPIIIFSPIPTETILEYI